jgi:enoyl-CoA hydratase/carnithine racemase
MALDLGPQQPGAISTTVNGAIGTIWLNRPEKRNAVSLESWAALPTAVHQLEADDAVKVIVFRGVGDHFCGGADIATIGAQLTDGDGPTSYRQINKVAEETIAAATKPTIAMLRGYCVGGGCQISLACDLRVADTTVKMGITVAKLGFSYPGFALERCARLIGASKTRYILYSGDIIDADLVEQWGMADFVVAPEALEAKVEGIATMMASRSMLTIRATKEQLASFDATSTISDEVTARWEYEAKHGADITEGVDAFVNKRTPSFTWTKPSF